MRGWLKITTGPVFWIAAVQAAWTVTLVGWIIFFVERRRSYPSEGWFPFVLGISMLTLMLIGETVIVIHFGRQVAQNRAVRDFVSQISHDLRSPLASVKLHVETLQLRQLDAAQREACLSMALQELGRLEAGLEDVLTASRIERKGLRVSPDRVELRPFLDEYTEEKRPWVEAQGARLVWEPASAVDTAAQADQQMLRKLLDNLVTNAVAHCQRGVTVELGLSEQGRCALLSVRDDGPGLERSERKRIFRMFYRAQGAKRHTRGTGLGLFIVASIARAHGGSAWVDCAGPGRGCTFRVALPLAKGGERGAA